MILMFNYRKLLWITLSVLTGTLLTVFSLNYLIAAEDEYVAVKVVRNNDSNENDIQSVLYENSVLDSTMLEIEGTASYYGKKFHKRKTASGERYDMNKYTAAHRTLPFGTILKVTNLENSKSTFVRINDRGHYVRKRIIDLSKHSAHSIEGKGLPFVKIEGFVRKMTDLSNQPDKNYFFAYSFAHKPVIVPADYLSIRHSFRDFSQAVEYYRELLDSKLADSSDTFIVFDDDTFSSFDDLTENYHIATWTPVLRRRIPVMMAEKIYTIN